MRVTAKIFCCVLGGLILFSPPLLARWDPDPQTDEVKPEGQDPEDLGQEVIVKSKKIWLRSPAFDDGDPIPEKYTCDGADISPSLSWEGVPTNTESIAVIMEDPDAPAGNWVHWVIYNLPDNMTTLSENVPKEQMLFDDALQGVNSFIKDGYSGPCPPPGVAHRYIFRVYALDTDLSLETGATKREVVDAMRGHILAEGELTGKYQRKQKG